MGLDSLCTVADYAAQRSHIFRSPTAIRWFIRRFRSELVERGALVLLLGAWFVDPVKADQVVADLGRRNAAARVKEADL